MKAEDSKPILKEPSFTYEGKYSYADYLNWQMEDMVEIIKGKVFKMTPAPSRLHQKIAIKLGSDLFHFLKDKPCEVYTAPFDVRLPTFSPKNEDIFTVVQPDICVICDKSKLDDAGCMGAPDLIVEILSKGNNRKELQNKFEVYQESGVKEYWIIHPNEKTLLIYTLKNQVFFPSRLYASGDYVSSVSIQGFILNLEEFFRDLE